MSAEREPGDLRESMQRLAGELDRVTPSAQLEARVLEGRSPRRPVRLISVTAAFAFAVVVLLVVVAGRAEKKVDGFRVLTAAAGSVVAQGHGQVHVDQRGAELVDPSGEAKLAIEGEALVQAAPRGIVWHRGRVRISVKKHQAQPWRVEVSDGVIEVLGTEFVVDQKASSGEAVLLEGRIRFVSKSGRVVLLAPGETVRWPLTEAEPPTVVEPPSVDAGTPEPETTPPRKPVPTKRTEPPSIGQVLDLVATARQRGQFEHAIATLRSALARPDFTPDTKERLSYELGLILTDQLHSPEACAHWSGHVRRWPAVGSRFGRDVDLARQRAGCGG